MWLAARPVGDVAWLGIAACCSAAAAGGWGRGEGAQCFAAAYLRLLPLAAPCGPAGARRVTTSPSILVLVGGHPFGKTHLPAVVPF